MNHNTLNVVHLIASRKSNSLSAFLDILKEDKPTGSQPNETDVALISNPAASNTDAATASSAPPLSSARGVSRLCVPPLRACAPVNDGAHPLSAILSKLLSKRIIDEASAASAQTLIDGGNIQLAADIVMSAWAAHSRSNPPSPGSPTTATPDQSKFPGMLPSSLRPDNMRILGEQCQDRKISAYQ